MNKYIKFLLYLIPIIVLVYLGRLTYKKEIRKKSSDQLVPIEPPHSHDYAYKRAYLNPVNQNNELCRANRVGSKCNRTCEEYHYNFGECVYKQPKCVDLGCEDNKESHTEKVIKSLGYN